MSVDGKLSNHLTKAEWQLLYRLRQLCNENERDETSILLELTSREEMRLRVLSDRREALGGNLTKENT